MNTHASRIADGEGLWRRGMDVRRGLSVDDAGRAALERLSRSATRRGGRPGAGGAVVARRRDQRRDRDPAGGAGRAGETLARRVAGRRARVAALAPATGLDAAQ